MPQAPARADRQIAFFEDGDLWRDGEAAPPESPAGWYFRPRGAAAVWVGPYPTAEAAGSAPRGGDPSTAARRRLNDWLRSREDRRPPPPAARRPRPRPASPAPEPKPEAPPEAAPPPPEPPPPPDETPRQFALGLPPDPDPAPEAEPRPRPRRPRRPPAEADHPRPVQGTLALDPAEGDP